MNLAYYLERVGFAGTPRADLDTLTRLHRGHATYIPYENLDVQFGRKVTREPAAIFDKLVTRGRGGWCYEMNGLLGWALEEIGFEITPMAGGVRRAQLGDWTLGNHLVLWVHLDRPYLADVGFGDGLIDPVPIAAGQIRQGLLTFALEELGQGWWRFHGDPRGNGPSFDFAMKPADEAVLDERCTWLQSVPESPFVQNAVLQRHLADGHATLRGKMLRMVGETVETRELASANEYVETLDRVFGLRLAEARALWPKIEARHREVFAVKPSG
jgi:N-hydroxyarylamine O-acetyltransferase